MAIDIVARGLALEALEGEKPANTIEYDNTESGLESTNVQDAIDEVLEIPPTLVTDILYEDLVMKVSTSELIKGMFYRITDYQTVFVTDIGSPNKLDFVVLSGNSGTATLNIVGCDPKTITYATDLNTTIDNFISANSTYYSNLDIQIYNNGNNTLGFRSNTLGISHGDVTITNLTLTLNGTVYNASDDALRFGPVEPLTILAIDNHTLDVVAKSELYPQDIIHYSLTPEVMPQEISFTSWQSPLHKGYMYYRKDTVKNIATHYDWRNFKFRRFGPPLTPPAWEMFRFYSMGDIVSYGENNYIATSSNPDTMQSPDMNPMDWDLYQGDCAIYNKTNYTLGDLFVDYVTFQGGLDSAGNVSITGGPGDIGGSVFMGTCRNNTIGDYFSYNTISHDFYDNTIGDNFSYNTISHDFYDNTIGDNFSGNTIGGRFSNNTIGNYFSNNTIGDMFRRNKIENFFQTNIIEDFFNGNVVYNDFENNTTGFGFTQNTIYAEASYGVDYTFATHVYGSYNCTLFKNSNSISRLSYYNGDILTIVNIDA